MKPWLLLSLTAHALAADTKLGTEVSVARHLADSEEFRLPLNQLFTHGSLLARNDGEPSGDEGNVRCRLPRNDRPPDH